MTTIRQMKNLGVLYDVADLMEVRVKGDNPGWKQLQDFRDTWDETLAGVEKEPTEDILEALFKQKVKVRNCISHDLSIYDRAEKGTQVSLRSCGKVLIKKDLRSQSSRRSTNYPTRR